MRTLTATLLAEQARMSVKPLAKIDLNNAIDVGNPAIDRTSGAVQGSTIIDLTNPANDSGILTDVDLWFKINFGTPANVKVGTFYLVSGVTYKCRAYAYVGTITPGSKQTVSGLAIPIHAGDFIGIFWSNLSTESSIEQDSAGYVGYAYKIGDYVTVGSETTYTVGSNGRISVYGYRTGNSYSYSTERILDIKQTELDDSQRVEVLLNNSDKALTSLDLRGYTATLSYGAKTTAGDEYSACAPMKVLNQDLLSAQGYLRCLLTLVGIPDQLEADKASKDYAHHASDTKTVKSLITEVLSGQPTAATLTEEQASTTSNLSVSNGWWVMAGQRLVIPNRKVTNIGFLMYKVGAPTGTAYYVLKSTYDGSQIARIAFDPSTLAGTAAWAERALSAATVINDEVRLYVEYAGAGTANYVAVKCSTANPKSGEVAEQTAATMSGWLTLPTTDACYRYKYTATGIDVFGHCVAYTATYDSEDAVIDTYQPKDSFTIALGESRLSVVKRLLGYTSEEMRVPADGQVHILVPQSIPESYYGLAPKMTPYESYNPEALLFSATIYGAQWRGQSFTPSTAHTINYAKFRLFRGGSPGTVTCDVWATDGSGHPTGTALCKGYISGNDLTANTAGSTYTILLGGAALAANTKYALSLKAPDGSSTNYVAFNVKTAGGYSGGITEVSNNSGGTWSVASGSIDFEFEEGRADHIFYSEVNRNRLVIPNKVTVKTYASAGTAYSGTAASSASFNLLAIEDFRQMPLVSDAQAGSIVSAIITRLENSANKGSATVPMNVGAEVWDYVNVVDARQGNSQAGNIGMLTRHYGQNEWSMSLSFGKVAREGIKGTLPTERTDGVETSPQPTYDDMLQVKDSMRDIDYQLNQLKGEHEWIKQQYVTGSALNTALLDALINYLSLDGGVMNSGGSSVIDMNSSKIMGLAAATANGEAVRYEQLLNNVTQYSLYGSRAFSTDYQNTTGYARRVAVTLQFTVASAADTILNGESSANAYCAAGSGASLTTRVGIAGIKPNGLTLAFAGDQLVTAGNLSFDVPNSYYYKLTNQISDDGVTPTISEWFEWDKS